MLGMIAPKPAIAGVQITRNDQLDGWVVGNKGGDTVPKGSADRNRHIRSDVSVQQDNFRVY